MSIKGKLIPFSEYMNKKTEKDWSWSSQENDM